MKAIAFLKNAAPLVAVFVFAVGVLNFGSYDPYNELTVFTPDVVAAQVAGGLTIPSLSTPTLSAPTLSTPTVTTPTVETPTLTVPEVSVPEIEVPEVDVPSVTVPELEVPTVETPTLTVPEVSVPEVTVPSLTVPTVTTSGSYSGSYTLKTCNISANLYQVTAGASVVISWTTSGFSKVTINGEVMNTTSGSKTYNNIQANTTYTIVAEDSKGNSCSNSITVLCVPPVVVPKCELNPAATTIYTGQSVNLNWTTENAASASLTSFGAVELSGTRNTGALATTTNYTLTVVGTNGDTVQCHSKVTVKPRDVIKYCELTLEKSVSTTTAQPGDELTYTIKIKNTGTADCTGGGVKILDIHDDNIIYVSETHTSNLNAGYGSIPVYTPSTKTLHWNGNTLNPGEEGTIVWKGKVKENLACDTTTIVRNTAKATAKELNDFKNWVYSNTVETSVYKACVVPPASCDAFAVSPTTLTLGDSATLSWSTTNATRVVIDNAIGEVAASGTLSITPMATTTYTLTAYGVNDQKDTCATTIVVEKPPVVTVPKCDAFTASPTSLPFGGGSVTLAWSTQNAGTVSISPTIGTVAASGSTTVTIATTTTYTLTASDVSGSKDTCAVTIPVAPPTPTPITCAANVSISASPTLINRGDDATITWSTSGGITGVRFDQEITSTGLSGSATVSPTSRTTYTLIATDGTDTISCPVSVDVRTGGGGGGSNAPRCEFSVSKKSIRSGESVVLTWDSTRATTLFIEDQTLDKKIVTTEGKLSDEKDELFDGKITVSPKEDTRYLLTVKRGSTTRTCAVEVEVDKDVVVTQIRDQQPLVSGIALTQVPYTGFEAGPILTLLFYVLLMAWALYVAYLLVIRRDTFGGLTLATAKVTTPAPTPEAIRPDVFVAKVVAPEMPVSTLPTNLPTGTPAIGYANHVEDEVVVSTNVQDVDEAMMTEIENFAHSKHVLLSSDAIRHFAATTKNETERQLALEQVITAAKAQFPAEDGWIVINEKRMQELCLVCAANQVRSNAAPFVPAVLPEGAGSLAEAIVTGNVVAAYEMIGHRPMFALADASADLDAVYRIRRGGNAVASELLMKATASLTEAQLLQMIEALTGALDGTYTDEAAAVKMAIMKAIKVVA